MVIGLFASCRKSDNSKLPDITDVPLPLITTDATADATISAQTPDAFSGKFIVGLYFPEGLKPAKFDAVVIKNGNKAIVKTIATDITTYPSTIAVTGAQLKTLFGSAIIVGDKFDIGVNITTTEGKTFLAFPSIGVAYGPGISAPKGSSTTVRFEAICKYTATDFGAIGVPTDFKVVQDGWEDYAIGQTIPVTVIDATRISFKYGANNAKPIIVTINPASNITSVTKAVYGDYGPSTGDVSAESVSGSADNFVAPCDLSFSVKLNHTSAKGNYGNYTIQLKKK